jgi:CheY-like chemotaxis protein
MLSSKPILLVEDEKIDAMIVERALKDLNLKNELVHVSNGEEALKHLKNNGDMKPCLILLDLDMPRMNGIEFLKIAKNDEQLKGIPVIVLTSSDEARNVDESFKSNVAGYIIKPADYRKFVEAIKTVTLYWNLCESPVGG